ncbi:MAG: NADH-quinone oxidoreductase subunit M [Chloroflexi bacterium]|nr:NADH-quinone oxidoreductase subunit M [Chloroflexota bacterium]
MNDWVLFLLVAVPLGGGVGLMFFPSSRPELTRWSASIVAGLSLLLALYVFLGYDWQDRETPFQYVRQFPWLPVLGITYALGVDGIAVPMVLLTGIVFFAGVLVSWNIASRPKDFFVLYCLLVAGVFGVFVSQDLFFLFFFYELAVVPMYLLIGVWGSSTDFRTFVRTKEYGAMKLVLYLVAGSALVWVALLAVYVASGKGSFLIPVLGQADFGLGFQRFFFPLFMVGFGILAGLWPFHTWSPDGHVAAPTGVSMVHAGVLMKLGAFGIIRAMEVLPDGAQTWMPVLIGLGTVNVLYGAISAMAQRDLKYVVGYSSVSHMGYVLMGLGTLNALGMGGAVLQMFSHGIMTALFFALVGFIYDRAHIRDIGVLEGLSKRMGVTGAFFVVAGLTSLGLPGLSGFVAEVLVFLGTFQAFPVLGALAVVGAAITAVYILRLLAKVFHGPLPERWAHLREATPLELGAAGLLVSMLVLVGVYPAPFMRIINSGIEPFLKLVAGA